MCMRACVYVCVCVVYILVFMGSKGLIYLRILFECLNSYPLSAYLCLYVYDDSLDRITKSILQFQTDGHKHDWLLARCRLKKDQKLSLSFHCLGVYKMIIS